MKKTLGIICSGIHCIAMFKNLLKIKCSNVRTVYVFQKARYKGIVTKRLRILISEYALLNAPFAPEGKLVV